MDTSLTPPAETGRLTWGLRNDDGEDLGCIVQDGTDFRIEPTGSSLLDGLADRPFARLEDAVVAIEAETGGRCRLWASG